MNNCFSYYRLILITLTLFGTKTVVAQADYTFYCTQQTVCSFNVKTEKHDICKSKEQTCTFVISTDHTKIKRFANDVLEVEYTIVDTANQGNTWIYDLTTAKGENIMAVFDADNKQIRLLTDPESKASVITTYKFIYRWINR